MDGPRIFDLSPPGLGGEWLARLMRANGIPARHGEGGALARDLCWAAAQGGPPCPDRPRVRFYGGLEAAQDPAAPPAFGWRHFALLRRTFRQAVFLLVLRDPDDWIAARLAEGGGRPARLQAIARDVPLTALPALWRADYAGLIAAARAFFAGDARYVELPFERLSHALLRDALAPWRALDHALPPPEAPLPAPPPAALPPLPRWPAPARITPSLRGAEAAFADRMAAHCLGVWRPGGGLGPVSSLYGRFDGLDGVLRRDGTPWPVARSPDLPGRPFIWPGTGPAKAGRLPGVLNECLRLGRLLPMHLDMADARRIGRDAAGAVGVPLVTYNRRAGAVNLTLWPLPGYHTPGLASFAQPVSPDAVPWADKADRVAWRGDLSGQARLPGGGFGPSAHRILSALDRIGPRDEAGLAAIMAELDRVPRMAAMRALRGPDFDLAFTLSRHMQDFAPALTGLLDRRRPPEWFHGFRYVLSLPGHDTGSNFIMAANSGSLVLKAEDGWELFHTDLFQPWEHYVPLKTDASDAPERLDWARRHPRECRAMVAAAQAACAQLADLRLRAGMLHRILDGLEGRA